MQTIKVRTWFKYVKEIVIGFENSTILRKNSCHATDVNATTYFVVSDTSNIIYVFSFAISKKTYYLTYPYSGKN
jgi:hypothetical protein